MSYGVDTTEANLYGPMVSLQVLYDEMPKTSGCERCQEINGPERKDWCCVLQNPSMYYVEFLKVYQSVEKWERDKRKELILRALHNYLDNSLSKGCIFYNNGCQTYENRPFGCKMYGVIPAVSWERRWELLKERQGESFEAKPQCTLVTAEKEISPELEDKWFLHTRNCEDRIGVPREIINLHDFAGGSYRSFHDHLLLELFGEEILSILTNVRMSSPSREDIELTIDELRSTIDEVDRIRGPKNEKALSS
ncbi:MAG: hypothetical protein ACXAC5_00570 [Promethearchaeota archaeon]|jgi:Fe-S-cluster containining protein